MLNNTTIIIYDSVKELIPYIKQKGILIYPSFKKVNILEKVLRKISFLTGVQKNKWYAEWKNKLKDVDTIIVFATKRIDCVQYIQEINPSIRIILWYWNPAFSCYNPSLIPDNLCEKWSFDEVDCENFGMNYNTTFYLDNIYLNKKRTEFEVLFLGADKGRKSSLINIESKLTEKGINTYLHIVPDRNSSNPENIKEISYEEYLNLISKSNVILDFIQDGQSGLTLRTMESLFFKKKLITNDISIMNHDFYNPMNIFVLGRDDESHLKEFITSTYCEIETAVIEKYDFNNWLERFNE